MEYYELIELLIFLEVKDKFNGISIEIDVARARAGLPDLEACASWPWSLPSRAPAADDDSSLVHQLKQEHAVALRFSAEVVAAKEEATKQRNEADAAKAAAEAAVNVKEKDKLQLQADMKQAKAEAAQAKADKKQAEAAQAEAALAKTAADRQVKVWFDEQQQPSGAAAVVKFHTEVPNGLPENLKAIYKNYIIYYASRSIFFENIKKKENVVSNSLIEAAATAASAAVAAAAATGSAAADPVAAAARRRSVKLRQPDGGCGE